jgi:hypothetical protein
MVCKHMLASNEECILGLLVGFHIPSPRPVFAFIYNLVSGMYTEFCVGGVLRFGLGVRFQARVRDFSLLHSVQTGSEGHAVSCSVRTLPKGTAAWA